MRTIRPSSSLANVRYEIRGDLARRAHEMERLGYEIIPLNIGNPGLFGFRTPETMRLAMIENLKSSEAYCHQKGMFPAREAVVMQQQSRGVRGVSADEVFMGNGVSELIDLVLRALLSTDDEVLVPSPDYPLWTAAVNVESRPRRSLSVPARERLRAGPARHRGADHQPHARDRRHQSEQPDRRRVFARHARSDRAASPSGITSSCSATRSTTRSCTTTPSSCRWRRSCTARCARRSPACRRSIAPAAIASAGPCSRATSSRRASI